MIISSSPTGLLFLCPNEEVSKTANRIKGITIEIGGDTTKLQTALKDVNSNIKDTQAQLKDVDRLLKLDPNNVELLSQKQDLLSKAVGSTRDKLSTLKTAAEQANDALAKGEISQSQYNSLQREIIATEQDLKGLEKQQGETNKKVDELNNKNTDKLKNSIAKLGTEMKSAASAAGKVAVEVGKVGAQTLSAATKAFTGYTTAITGAATAAFKLAADSALAADDLNTLSTQTGISTQDLQKYQYAADLVDVSVDTLTKSMAKNIKQMTSTSAATVEAYKKLGVATKNSDGSLRDSQEVYWECIKALGEISDETERDSIAMAIFGKSAQELNPLIEGGAEKIAELGEQAESLGLIMSQDSLDGLNAFNDSIDTLKANAAASGNIIGSVFAPAFKGLTDIVGSELPSISQAFAGIFESEDGAEGFAEKITEVAGELTEKVSELVPDFISGFNAVILSVIEAITATLPTAVSDILPALLIGFTALVSGVVDAIPDLVPTVAEGAITLFQGLLDGLNSISEKLMPMLPDLITDLCDLLIDGLPDFINGAVQLFIGLVTGLGNTVPTLVQKVGELLPVIINTLLDNIPLLIECAVDLFTALATGIPQAIPAIIKAVPLIIGKIIEVLFETDWLDIGAQILNGIADGMIQAVTSIGGAIKEVGSGLVEGFKDFFGIASPSKLFRDEIGLYLAEGIGVGFGRGMKDVTADMVDAVPTDFNIDANLNSNNSGSKSITFNQYNTSPKSLSRAEIHRDTMQALQLASIR